MTWHTGWLKKVSCILWWIFQQSRTIFQKLFHCYALSRKSAIKRLLQTSPHLKSVITLPCKILIFKHCIDRKHSNGWPGVRMLKRSREVNVPLSSGYTIYIPLRKWKNCTELTIEIQLASLHRIVTAWDGWSTCTRVVRMMPGSWMTK